MRLRAVGVFVACALSLTGSAWAQWSACTGGTCYTGGNVGIGTTSPVVDTNVSTFLTLDGGVNRLGEIALGGNQSGTSGLIGGLDFFNSYLTTSDRRIAVIASSTDGATNSGNLQFYTYADGVFGERLRVTSGGAVGIGTTTPRTNLDLGMGYLASNRLTLVQDMTSTSNTWQVDNTAGLFRLFWQPGFGANGTVVLCATTSGNVGIGEASPQYPLSVKGTIQAMEVLVNTNFADYVFEPGYHVRPLAETAEYIKANHHLPDIPSAAEVKEKGLGLGDMQTKLLAKIEELTLQMIELNKQNEQLQKRVAELEKR